MLYERSHGPLLCAFCLSFHFKVPLHGATLLRATLLRATMLHATMLRATLLRATMSHAKLLVDGPYVLRHRLDFGVLFQICDNSSSL